MDFRVRRPTVQTLIVSNSETYRLTVHRLVGVRLLPVIAVSSLLPALWLLQTFRSLRGGKVGQRPSEGCDHYAKSDQLAVPHYRLRVILIKRSARTRLSARTSVVELLRTFLS